VFAGWASAKKLAEYIEAGCTPLDDDGTILRYYLSKKGVIYYHRKNRVSRYIQTVLRNMGTTERNRYELEAMGVHFTYPKPKELIAYLISMITDRDDIVLDSFIGSGTTAHSTLLANREDGARRQFIGIELDAEIATRVLHPRVRAVVEGFQAKSGKNVRKRVMDLGSGFRYCKLGVPLFDERGNIRESVRFTELAAHVFFTETGSPIPKRATGRTALLGVHNGKAVYLLFNGVMGDKRPDGGNVLTGRLLAELPSPRPSLKGRGVESGNPLVRVVYGEGCRLGPARLKREGIVFRQIPYQIKVS